MVDLGQPPYYGSSPPPRRSRGLQILALCLSGLTLIACVGAIATMSPKDPMPGMVSTTPSVMDQTPTRIQPPSTKGGPSTSIGEGTWLVGKQVKPGRYVTRGAAPGPVPLCYWHTAKDTTDEHIVEQGVVDGPNEQGIANLKKGEYFQTSGCAPWEIQ